MANPSSENPTMLSDGKRTRPVWRPGDGNGDPSRHTIERTIGQMKGHPTWKLFMGEVEIPIIIDTLSEPPHYVYLDDKACYTIWCTKAYTNEELREFWPFDFDHQGNISTARKQRGRPAYSDEEETRFAKVPLRYKGKSYEFFGAPEVTDYAPRKPRKKTKAEMEVEAEIAKLERMEAAGELPPEVPVTQPPNRRTPELSKMGLKSLPLSPRPVAGPFGDHPQQTSRKRRLSQLSDASSTNTSPRPSLTLRKHLQQTSEKGQPNPFNASSSERRPSVTWVKRARLSPSTSTHTPSQKALPSHQLDGSNDDVDMGDTGKKRNSIQPFDVSSSSGDSSSVAHSPERPQFSLSRLMQSPSKTIPPDFGMHGTDHKNITFNASLDGTADNPITFDDAMGGTNDTDGEYHKTLAERCIRAQMPNTRPESLRNYILQSGQDTVMQLKEKNETLKARIKFLENELKHHRNAMVIMMAERAGHQADISHRVIALQKIANEFAACGNDIHRMAMAASAEVAPTLRLSDGLESVLDGPGKYMYDNGFDEEWRVLQAKANKIVKVKDESDWSPSSSQQKPWNFS